MITQNSAAQTARVKNKRLIRSLIRKGFSGKAAADAEGSCFRMMKRMKKEYVMIAFRKQDGTFCMRIGTLLPYQSFFHKQFHFLEMKGTMPYWDAEEENWRTFQIENLISWKGMGY